MAGETKMILITSNEDLIRQFLTKEITKTQIIDLNDNKQRNSTTTNDNNIMELALLAELSELNSNRDQVYKRALDSPHQNRSKQLKSSKKSVDLICGICGDRAIGFNYDALSCASCKAFFRRNANQPPEKVRCLTGQGQCSTSHEMRRKCARCRLDRCFFVGMRKDFILSEEEKQERKKRLEENRNLTSNRSSTLESVTSSSSSQPLENSESVSEILDEIDHLMENIDGTNENILLPENGVLNTIEDMSWDTLSVEDWITILSVRSSFLSAIEDENSSVCSVDVTDRVSALVFWSQRATQYALSSISFFRQIDEFDSLNNDDRFILIKYNLLPTSRLFKCYSLQTMNERCSREYEVSAEMYRQYSMLFDELPDISQRLKNLSVLIVELTEQDPTLFSLILVVLVFSKGLSMNENEPSLNDSLSVHRAQNRYTELLWNYLINKYGDVQIYNYFIRLLTMIFRIQSGSKILQEFMRTQLMLSNAVDRLEPLVQSILHIS